jgi:CBS domain containing-hemolysin-like protein
MSFWTKLAGPLSALIEAIAAAFFRIKAEEKRKKEHKKKSEEFDEALKEGDPDKIREHLDDLVRK